MNRYQLHQFVRTQLKSLQNIYQHEICTFVCSCGRRHDRINGKNAIVPHIQVFSEVDFLFKKQQANELLGKAIRSCKKQVHEHFQYLLLYSKHKLIANSIYFPSIASLYSSLRVKPGLCLTSI